MKKIDKINPNESIGGFKFKDFEKMMNNYYDNAETGGKLKTPESIQKGKGKFAWIFSGDDLSITRMDEYHRNIKSFDLAFNQVTKEHYARAKAWWGCISDELEIIGDYPSDPKNKYHGKIFSKNEIEKAVMDSGSFHFRMKYKGDDEKKKGCWQEWSAIYTMEALDKEENDLKNIFQEEAQEEADRTGKKAVVTNMVGWRFEAEPKNPKKVRK